MIYIITVIALVFTLANIFIAVYFKGDSYDRISFREAVDLTGNPIVVFYNGNKKLHFLLDTGANVSMINKEDLKDCSFIDTNTSMNNVGIEGNNKTLPVISMNLKYRNRLFKEDLLISDLSAAFSEVKKTTGVTIHGILGTSFFTKYKYVLDFDELVAYSKMRL